MAVSWRGRRRKFEADFHPILPDYFGAYSAKARAGQPGKPPRQIDGLVKRDTCAGFREIDGGARNGIAPEHDYPGKACFLACVRP